MDSDLFSPIAVEALTEGERQSRLRWCGDYTGTGGGGPLTITFRYPQAVEAGWSA
jgi:hypothetical protein